MKEICVFDKTLIYRPSFNDVLRASLYKATKDAPKDKKFRILIEPVEKPEPVEQTELSSSFAKIVNEYVESHQPTPEEIERLKEIPLDDMKQMVKLWWDEFISGGITDDSK